MMKDSKEVCAATHIWTYNVMYIKLKYVMIIRKYVFRNGEILYLIFDDKNIHINRWVSWKSIDDLYVYDLIYIHFYPNSSANEHSLASIWDARRKVMSRDSILNHLNYSYYIELEEDSDEFKKTVNLYNTLI